MEMARSLSPSTTSKPASAEGNVWAGTQDGLVRFRPHLTGSWKLKVRVLCWHPNSDPRDDKSAKRTSSKDKTKTYYEHEFGYKAEDIKKYPGAEVRFTVNEAKLGGSLEAPDPTKKDNPNYFYRWIEMGREYKRRPFFLLGTARPWVTDVTSWDSFLDRDTQLFEPMRKAGCNVLYHWMAPFESQLVHQAQDEWWPDPKARYPKKKNLPYGAYPGSKLSGANAELGYKRYDQGRALHTDYIFDIAQKHQILLFLVVMSHQSLNEHPHPWHGEHGWSMIHERYNPPSKLNGFQLFQKSPGSQISIQEFFSMDPADKSANSWQRRLWKHFANYWRYIIGRWTAHPALGAWFLIDELEGVGTHPFWWWENRGRTYPWHDNFVRLMRGKLQWEWEAKSLPYTGDYLNHPLTTSTTHYEASDPRPHREERPKKPRNEAEALEMINNFSELEDHGTWLGATEKTDFVSHHAYQAVPTWGIWGDTPREYHPDRWTGWHLPNEAETQYINTDKWLWDSLCMRLRKWGKANAKVTRLVTEYGCLERSQPGDVWDFFGKRVPSFTHFANWASLVLGHAGVPSKWNDGTNLGEMTARTSPHRVWSKEKYPVDNYAEIMNIAKFLKDMALDDMYPEEFVILDEHDKTCNNYNAWALVNIARKIALIWIYDRNFEGPLKTRDKCSLRVDKALPEQWYTYELFDTWAGVAIIDIHRSLRSDKKGIVKIPLPRLFPTIPASRDPAVTAAKPRSDGNDIALRLILDPSHI